MKKILVNAYVVNNFGDDLFLKILFERYKNVEWVLYEYDEYSRKTFAEYENITYLKKGILNRILEKLGIVNQLYWRKLLDGIDAYLIIGGSVFQEEKSTKIIDEKRMAIQSILKEKGNKTFVLGSNFGPMISEEFFRKYSDFFEKCEDVCFRDRESYDKFRKIPNVRHNPDIVLQLETDEIQTEEIIGVSLINIKNRKDINKFESYYLDLHNSLIKSYIQNGYKVNLFSFCNKEGDKEAINHILEKVSDEEKKKINVIEYEGNIKFFISELKKCEIFLGTRFHSIVLAILFRQKFYAFSYSMKTVNLLNDIGLNNYCKICDCNKISHKEILEIINNTKYVFNKKIAEQSREQFKILDKYIKSKD